MTNINKEKKGLKKVAVFFELVRTRLVFICGAFSAIAIFLMALLIMVDILGRYLFKSPTNIANEMSGYLLVATIFLGLAHTQKEQRHIAVTFLIDKLSEKFRKRLNIVIEIVTIIFVVWLALQTADSALIDYVNGTVSLTFVRTPLWIPRLLIPVGLCIYAVQLASEIVTQLLSPQAGTIRDENSD